jgi:C_GCAxxG_C_C family probable redox protein
MRYTVSENSAEKGVDMKSIKNYSVEEITDLFMHGIDCSQVVAAAFSSELGVDEKELLRLTSAFGGGMLAGKTCGAVIAAFMLLGLKYGHDHRDDADGKTEIYKKMAQFRMEFQKRYDSEECSGLLGYNLTDSDEAAKHQEENLLLTRCPVIVKDTIDILEGLL